ncbi:MAG: MFS transporter [Acetobacteraceae bacterium]|nr:MFS transporter [Acetobacteraceae bacterium]
MEASDQRLLVTGGKRPRRPAAGPTGRPAGGEEGWAPGPAGGPPASAPNPRRWLILLGVLAGSIMGPIDGSIVNANLPVVARFFGASMALAGWVPMSYMLVLGSLLPTVGRLGDLYGFRRLFLWGVGVFVAASALCGLSPTMGFLIGARALQALGAAMTMAVTPALITSAFPPQERGRALGISGVSVAVGLSVGPSLGGLVAATLGWRWMFYINLPIGLAAMTFSGRVIPRDVPGRRARFDPAGSTLAFAALFLTLLVASQGGRWGARSAPFLAGAVAAAGLWGAFVAVERRQAEPMLDLGLFGIPPFALAMAASLLNFMAQYSVVFLTPFLLGQALGLPPDRVGLIMTAAPLATLCAAPLSGTLSDYIGTRWLAAAGLSLCTGAMFLLTRLPASPQPVDLVWRLALFGLGTGVFQAPNNSAAMGSAPRRRLGTASGVLATVRNVGMSLGVAVASGVFLSAQARGLRAGLAPEPAFTGALRAAFLVSTAFEAVGVLACLASPGVKGEAGVGGEGSEGGAEGPSPDGRTMSGLTARR